MKKTDLSQEDARRLFDYVDGFLIWKARPESDFATVGAFKDWNKKFPGSIAGTETDRGYRTIGVRINGQVRRVLAHRVIWAWHYGPSTLEIDHKDHDTRNNRIGNLREATGRQNKANRRKLSPATCSYNGVSFEKDRKKWKVGIRKAGGSTVTVGRFRCPTTAAFAYDRAAREEFGEFAKLNFPRQAKRGVAA